MPFDYVPTSTQSEMSHLLFTILDINGRESWMNLAQLHRLFKVYEGYVSIWECSMNQKTYVYFQSPETARKAAFDLNQMTNLNLISGEGVCLNYHNCSTKSPNLNNHQSMALVNTQPMVTHPPEEPYPVRYINNSNVLHVSLPNMGDNDRENIMSLPGFTKMDVIRDNEYCIEFDRCLAAKEAKEVVEEIVKGIRDLDVKFGEISTIQVREVMPSEQALKDFFVNTGDISVTSEKISLSLDNDRSFMTLKLSKVFQQLAKETAESIDPEFQKMVTQLIRDVFQHEKGHCITLNE